MARRDFKMINHATEGFVRQIQMEKRTTEETCTLGLLPPCAVDPFQQVFELLTFVSLEKAIFCRRPPSPQSSASPAFTRIAVASKSRALPAWWAAW